jgi:hypothetical protein
VVLTPAPLDADAIARAVAAVRERAGTGEQFALRALDDGAALQVLVGDTVVLSVLRPRLIPAPGELTRVLPGVTAPEGAQWWAEAYTPWHPGGAEGLAVLDAAAAASGGVAVHQIAGRSVHDSDTRTADRAHNLEGDDERHGA